MADEHEDDFNQLLAGLQPQIFAFAMSLLGDLSAAREVVQESNRVILQKRCEFESGTNFAGWAMAITRFQTMAWLRDQKRDRHILTPEISEVLTPRITQSLASEDPRYQALNDCIGKLSKEHQAMLHTRYVDSSTLSELSVQSGKSENALKQLFFRLRNTLTKCVENTLKEQQ
ncbi:MAG: sigma-70 family RNA polymerase sigma factor [Rubripirellula sp.]